MKDGSSRQGPEGVADKIPNAVAFIAGRSGTGKTTLMEALLTVLKGKGYRVGTVKHSGHQAAMDREGSDSWRFTQAGADITVLAASGQLAVLRNIDQPSLEDALLEASSGTDIVLVEGFKEMNLPKIEVYRSEHSEGLYFRRDKEPDPYLIAVASDTPLDIDVPVLNLNDPEEVCKFIVERFLKSRDS
ncbi:MAG: molybdopterin-guanine dinucleotide biosynthesis protein B [bacterium]|nr:molybdopterin-guanine dinucleotide biosynthesis protein B [bacterium]MDT8366162.1 molybdopterin-guanine dinucleotide biosynthesis protein B [bacterium]